VPCRAVPRHCNKQTQLLTTRQPNQHLSDPVGKRPSTCFFCDMPVLLVLMYKLTAANLTITNIPKP
jgi:hypothetical protein